MSQDTAGDGTGGSESDASRLGRRAVSAAGEPRIEMLWQVVRGYCMGAADIVPGVSGGTVALVFGIYERLVHNVRTGAGALGNFARLRWQSGFDRLREVEWRFLLPLLVGIGLAIVSLVKLIRYLLDEYPVETAAVFFGLIVASIVVAWRLISKPTPLHGVIIVAVAAITFGVLGLSSREITDPSALALFGSGALAICAMILPGVSGSFILLMLGVYHPVIDAVDERDFGMLIFFALGAVVGLALFSWLLDWVLSRYHDFVVAGLIGLMLGSLRVLWPWPADVPGGDTRAELGAPPGTDWVLPLVLAVVAAAAVLFVARRTKPLTAAHTTTEV